MWHLVVVNELFIMFDCIEGRTVHLRWDSMRQRFWYHIRAGTPCISFNIAWHICQYSQRIHLQCHPRLLIYTDVRSNLPSQFFSNKIHVKMSRFIWSCLCFEVIPIYLMAVFMIWFLCYVWLGVMENFSKLLVSSLYVSLDLTVHVAHPEGVSLFVFSNESFPLSKLLQGGLEDVSDGL